MAWLRTIGRWILRVLRFPLWAIIGVEFWLTSWFWWLILRLFPSGKGRPFPFPERRSP
jgi:hypothetical protein